MYDPRYDKELWVDYPENKPEENGYYMTYYFNGELNGHYYKAIYYNVGGADEGWVKWRASIPHISIERYIPASRNNWYVPCMMWFEELWKKDE